MHPHPPLLRRLDVKRNGDDAVEPRRHLVPRLDGPHALRRPCLRVLHCVPTVRLIWSIWCCSRVVDIIPSWTTSQPHPHTSHQAHTPKQRRPTREDDVPRLKREEVGYVRDEAGGLADHVLGARLLPRLAVDLDTRDW